MKIAHIGDEHIRDKGAEEIQRCLDFTVARIREEAPDLIISAGDMFDSQDIRAGSQATLMAIRFVSKLADIAPVAMVVGTPSHDGKAPEIFRHIQGLYEIYVATIPRQTYQQGWIFYERPTQEGDSDHCPIDAILTLIPTVTKQYFHTSSGIEDAGREIAQAMTGILAGFGAQAAQYPDVPHILVWHGGVSGARLPLGHVRSGMTIDLSTDQMMMSGCDIGLMGHIHQPQQIGDRFFYSGPLYPVKVDEQECGFWIHEQTGVSYQDTDGAVKDDGLVWNHRYIPTPFTRTVRFKEDFTVDGVPPEYSDQEFLDTSDGPGPGDHQGENIRIEFTAWQDEAGTINKAGIEKRFREAGAESVDIRINAIPRVTIRAESVLEAETLKDEFAEMAKLRGEKIDPEVLVMADMLEHLPADELLKGITEYRWKS